MDQDNIIKIKNQEWERRVRKIAKNCRNCEGYGFVLDGNRKGEECHICIPKARSLTYLMESNIPVDDLKELKELSDKSLLNDRAIFLQGYIDDRQKLGFTILREEALKQRKIRFIEMGNLVLDLKQGNKEVLQYDTVFIDSIDAYRTTDQFILPWFDGILFSFKNKPGKRIIVGGSSNTEGYAARFVELYGNNFNLKFV